MSTQLEDEPAAGFGTVDDKGRISLSKPVRTALGIQPGSSVAYVVLDHALLLIPQDEHLATLMERGRQALTSAGLSVRDLLDELPAAREEAITESYGADFLKEMEQLRQRLSDETHQ